MGRMASQAARPRVARVARSTSSALPFALLKVPLPYRHKLLWLEGQVPFYSLPILQSLQLLQQYGEFSVYYTSVVEYNCDFYLHDFEFILAILI